MRVHAKMKFLVLVLIMAVVMQACTDNQLSKMADALDVVTTSMAVVQKTTINAEATTPPLIQTATAAKILTLCLKVDKATKEAVTATKNVAKLDDKTNANLSGIIAPIVTAVDDVIADPSINAISDQKTKDGIRLALLSVQTSLATTQTILIASKKK